MWVLVIAIAAVAVLVTAYFYWFFRIRSHIARTPRAFAFHDIVRKPSITSASDVSLSQFVTFVEEAEKAGLQFVPIEDWLEATPESNKVLMTFDDGFESFYTFVYPILREKNIPAVLFLLGGFTGARPSWDYRAGSRKHLTHDEITELKADPLVTICSHSRSHPDLRKLSDRKLKSEIRPSVPGAEPHFSYPFGAFDDRVVDSIRLNVFESGFCTLNGDPSKWMKPYTIPRIPLNRFDNRFTIRTKLKGGMFFWIEILKARIIGAFAPFTYDWRGRL